MKAVNWASEDPIFQTMLQLYTQHFNVWLGKNTRISYRSIKKHDKVIMLNKDEKNVHVFFRNFFWFHYRNILRTPLRKHLCILSKLIYYTIHALSRKENVVSSNYGIRTNLRWELRLEGLGLYVISPRSCSFIDPVHQFEISVI